MDSDTYFIVGIDFGTTYSGAAILLATSPNDINLIKQWPGATRGPSDKTPSRNAYRHYEDPRNSSSVITATSLRRNWRPVPIRWGFEVSHDEHHVAYIKLCLRTNQDLPQFFNIPLICKIMADNNRRIVDCVSDYLHMMKKRVESYIREKYPFNVRSGVPRHYMLTVPSIWGPAEKHLTMLAAGRAGMSNVKLVAEPEAAAFSTLNALPSHAVQVGQTVVICDAGGGTVDLAPYKIHQISPLQLIKVAKNVGGLCGAGFLNLTFEQTLKARIGDTKFLSMKHNNPKALQYAMGEFEDHVKCNFQLNDQRPSFDFWLPNTADDDTVGIRGGRLRIPATDIRGVFESVVTDVIDLIRKQIDLVINRGAKVDAIIVVGGFSESGYLRDRIAQFVQSLTDPILLLRGPQPWSAVVRGAVLRRQQDLDMNERQAKLCYGVKDSPIFDRSIHPAQSRFTDGLTGRTHARNFIQWFIVQDDLISPRRQIDHEMVFNWPPDKERIRFRKEVYTCNSTEPPAMLDGTLKKVGTLVVDFTPPPEDLVRYKYHDPAEEEIRYVTLKANIRARLNMAGIEFLCKAGDIQYGSVQLKFEGEDVGDDSDDGDDSTDDGSFIQDDGEGEEDDDEDTMNVVDSDEE